MADSFYNLDEAAKLLNITPEKLGEMRENGEIRGFRDGSTWKFKSDEVDQLLGQQSSDDESSELDLQAEGDDDVTMLGEAPDLSAQLDGDLTDPRSQDDGDDDVTMLGEAPDLSAMLDIEDDDSESSLDLGAAESLLVNDKRDGSAASVIGDEKSGAGSPESDLQLSDGSESSLDNGDNVLDDSDLQLQENGGTGELSVGEEEADVGFDSSELADSSGDVELSDDDFALSDDDLVLSTDSAANSDITLGSGDSGINLGSPSDSGISLDEEPMELAGGSSSALGLPEDDSGLSLDDDLSDSEDFADLQKDEEFLLSPSDEGFGDSSDSGSQVIALSDSQAFDEDAATMIAEDRMFEEDPLGDDAGLLTEDPDLGGDGGLGAEYDPTVAGLGPQHQILAPIQAIEAPYSVWNLGGLFVILLLLIATGMSMTDVVRNMWSWEGGPEGVSNSVQNFFLAIYEFFVGKK